LANKDWKGGLEQGDQKSPGVIPLAIKDVFSIIQEVDPHFFQLTSFSVILVPFALFCPRWSEQLQWCSVCELAKIFLTSKFSYFAEPKHHVLTFLNPF
jgi:hypothetical protein